MFDFEPNFFYIYGYSSTNNTFTDYFLSFNKNLTSYKFDEKDGLCRSFVYLGLVSNNYQTPQIGERTGTTNEQETIWNSYYKIGLIKTPFEDKELNYGYYSANKFNSDFLVFNWFTDCFTFTPNSNGMVNSISGNASNFGSQVVNDIITIQFNLQNCTYYYLIVS